MIGAIAGDMIGSVYEAHPIKTTDFPLFASECRFTDDSVLTIAVADCILHENPYIDTFHEYFHAYPKAGYGGLFAAWARRRGRKPYHSWGNGAAMRVSPIGFAHRSLNKVLTHAKSSAEVTHNHEHGIRGAQAVAAAIFLARAGCNKIQIKDYLERTFAYDLSALLVDIRPHYYFDVSCQGSVPQAIIAFLESANYEEAVRNAISLGGDADTMACIAGGIAQAYHGGVPVEIRHWALELLDARLRSVVLAFAERFGAY